MIPDLHSWGSPLRRWMAKGPVLIGTWADASWTIRFYEKHGFQIVGAQEKDQLLRRYWTVPDRQIETSVVLADPMWWELNHTTYWADSASRVRGLS